MRRSELRSCSETSITASEARDTEPWSDALNWRDGRGIARSASPRWVIEATVCVSGVRSPSATILRRRRPVSTSSMVDT